MDYAVIKIKRIDGVRHLSLDTIFDNEIIAIGYCNQKNEISSVREEYLVKELSICVDIVQHDLIMRCMNIAACLHLAESCLFKNRSNSLENSLHWFRVAKERCRVAADLLEVL